MIYTPLRTSSPAKPAAETELSYRGRYIGEAREDAAPIPFGKTARLMTPSETLRSEVAPLDTGARGTVALADSDAKAVAAPSPDPSFFHAKSDGAGGLATENGKRRVRFLPGQIACSFEPMTRARRSYEWRYRFRQATRGSVAIATGVPPAPPASDGPRVSYDHESGLVERYTNLACGLEQEFQLASVPSGQDDLLIVGTVTTDLEGVPAGQGGISFVDSVTNVLRYSRAYAIDAEGRKIDVAVEFSENHDLTLRVPGFWVSNASLPITIDPLIESDITLTDTSYYEANSAVAWNSAANEYMVAFTYFQGQYSNRMPALQRITTSGARTGTTNLLAAPNTSVKTPMALCYSEPGTSYNRYCLAFSDYTTGASSSQVYVAVVNADGTLYSGVDPGRIYSGTNLERDPAIAYDPQNHQWLVVWENSGKIFGRTVSLSGYLGTTYTFTDTSDNNNADPTIAFSATTSKFLLAYHKTIWSGSNFTREVRTRTIPSSSYTASSYATIATGATNDTIEWPAVAWDSVDDNFLVVWSNLPGAWGSFKRVYGGRVTTNNTASGSAFAISPGTGGGWGWQTDYEREPTVGYSPSHNQFLVAWETQSSSGSTVPGVRGQLIAGSGGMIGSAFLIPSSSQSGGGAPGVEDRGVNATWDPGNSKWLVAYNASGAVYGNLVGTDFPPKVIRVDPPANTYGVWRDQKVVLDFSEALTSATINGSTVTLTPSGGSPIAATVSYDSTKWQVTLTPSSALLANTLYTVSVTGSVQDSLGTPHAGTWTSQLTTGAVTGLADSDGDGLLDLEEQALGIFGTPDDPDYDNDGLTDVAELFTYHTDPRVADTDGDGTSDGAEVTNATSPLVPNTGAPDITPPTFVAIFPSIGSSNVPAGTPIKVRFSEPLNTSTISTTNFVVKDGSSLAQITTGTFSFESNNTVVVYSPPGGTWLPTTNLSVELRGAQQGVSSANRIKDVAGNEFNPGNGLGTTFSVRTVSAADGKVVEPRYYLTTQMQHSEVYPNSLAQDPGTGGRGVAKLPLNQIGHTATKPIDELCPCLFEKDPKNTGMVVFLTGAFFYAALDLQNKTMGIPDSIHFVRTHRSNLSAARTSRSSSEILHEGSFGPAWSFSYDTYLEGITNGSGFTDYTFHDSDGREVTYIGTGTSTFTTPKGYYDTLSVSGSLVTMRKRDGLKYVFDTTKGGYLVKEIDRCGSSISFTRTASATGRYQLSQITDDKTGRAITITHHSATGKEDLVYQVQDWCSTPHTWTYEYNGSRNLTSVKTPTCDWLSDAGAAQTGQSKETTYTYDSAGVRLATVKDGRGTLSGTPLLSVAYDALGHAVQVDYGSATAFYTYDFGSSGSNFADKTTETDRAGHVTTAHHDAAQNINYADHLTQGIHLGEPQSYRTQYLHDDDSEVVQVKYPRGNGIRVVRNSVGLIEQAIRRESVDSPSNSSSDIVECWTYEPEFNQVRSYIEPRGNSAPVVRVLSLEDVSTDPPQPRVFAIDDDVQRRAYTKFFFYDHEDASALLAQNGLTLSPSLTLPKTYGRKSDGVLPGGLRDMAILDSNSDGKIDFGGNIYLVVHPQPVRVSSTTPSTFESARQSIQEAFTYNRHGQLVLHYHPDGQSDRNEWYSATYNASSNPGAGYLKRVELDTGYADTQIDDDGVALINSGTPNSSALALRTDFVYDPHGNATSVTSPRGTTATATFDALNLRTQVTAPAPFSYVRKFTYDGANNLVKAEVQNVVPNDVGTYGNNGVQDGATEQTASTAFFTHVFKYNSANALVEQTLDTVSVDASSPLNLTTRLTRDGRQRVVRVQKPLGNCDETYWDERDLVYKTVRASNDSSVKSQTLFDYDENGNLLQVVDDDAAEGSGYGATADMTYEYDGHDRIRAVTQEIGASTELKYDLGSRVIQVISRGRKTGLSSESNVILGWAFANYDELGRPFQRDAAFFDVVTGTSISDGPLVPPMNNASAMSGQLTATLVSSLTRYDDRSAVIQTIDDNNHRASVVYDRLHRLSRGQDHLGNTIDYAYDKNSNLIRITETEKDGDTGTTSGTYYTERFYDELDRLIATVSHMGNTQRYMWDSRGNLTQVSDAMGASGVYLSSIRDPFSEHDSDAGTSGLQCPQGDIQINARGNTVRFTYDALSRPLSTIRDLRSGGTGSGSVTGSITTSQTWDANSRVATQKDARNNETKYCYDNKDRLHETEYADGTRSLIEYFNTDAVRMTRDPRGVVSQYAYDQSERATEMAISNVPYGPGPASSAWPGQTTFVGYLHDGLGRMTLAEDNDSVVTFDYDSLSNVIREGQTVGATDRTTRSQTVSGPWKQVANVYDGVGNRTRVTYPVGSGAGNNSTGRIFDYAYDSLDRIDLVKEGAVTVADYAYVGMGDRRVERGYYNGTKAFSSYDGERRLTRFDHRRTSDNLRARGFEYGWDRANNRRYEQRLNVNNTTTESTGPGEFAVLRCMPESGGRCAGRGMKPLDTCALVRAA